MSDLKPIICLGLTFTTEEERREYFRNELRAKLPELKKIEGFPIGEDDDIINLSDPPYYTACPNPWLNDFIAEWEKEKENIPGRKRDFHVDEPFASDVSEGKEHLIYKAHSYHTKVPHPAIMRYILHYTQPGDIVFDGFAGTGMTGVAANQCESPEIEIKTRFESELSKTSNTNKITWGKRKNICSDLSPIASFISYNFNRPLETEYFLIANEIINEIEEEYKWIYQTKHTNGKIGTINFTIWSQVFNCPNCMGEIVFFNETTNPENGEMSDEFKCPFCSSLLTKNKLSKVYESIFDFPSSSSLRILKYKPALISYNWGSKRFYKKPDDYDLEALDRIKELLSSLQIPLYKIPRGDKTIEAINAGIIYHHQFYFDRSLLILKLFADRIGELRQYINISSTSAVLSKLYRLTSQGGSFGAGGGPMNGVIYIPSIIKELPVFKVIGEHILKTNRVKNLIKNPDGLISNQSMSDFNNLTSNSIDYIFTDPPFGANLMYSELNFLRESWLRLLTDNKPEAIENKTQSKSTLDYQEIMSRCFSEFYRILKPGKWMTVEFSNTSAAVWNGIQTAIQREGFIIANVAALDKKQGSFNAVNNVTSVKQDLVISCYKPTSEFENNFKANQGEIVVWDFVTEYLHHLPTHLRQDKSTTAIVERSSKILYDRLITYYLMRGLPVPIDSKDFQVGLIQRFIERDGMFFTAEQAAEYDEKKAKAPQFVQLSLIVTNESDAIEWLKDRLRKQPQKYQDIMPDFRIATQSLRKGDTLPELQVILEQNFYEESDGRWYIPDLTQAKVREAIRNKALLKEFGAYVAAISQPRAKKLKEVRVESLRAGFKNCWAQKDFKTIVTMGDMIPLNILLEDEQLLMYYDIAKDRV